MSDEKIASPSEESPRMASVSSVQKAHESEMENVDKDMGKADDTAQNALVPAKQKKTFWLVAWVKNQINSFNPILLIMAFKYPCCYLEV
jgi:hypothetical protein